MGTWQKRASRLFVANVEKLGIPSRNAPMAGSAISVEKQTTSSEIAQSHLPTN
ncbi:hypothetical protein FQN60_016012 [Etheostoma spectabile]|uniref:Uncharacterized protein n=1 Tax=Etheostoma spectabile TaxID=54343 RepID=A0A5J5CBD3_9PERO|nr:hypothetical protein FQN60_016012 [Etheostoma spectabile]